MKAFNFKSKGSVLRVIEEPTIKKRKWTFDRIIYIGLIVFIAFISITYGYNILNVIKGNGQIVFQKLPINFTTDIRLNKMYITEGEKVHKGDTLFSYTIERSFEDEQNNIRQSETKNRMLRDVLSIEREIMLKKATLNHKHKQLNEWKKIYAKNVDLVLLEVTPKNTLDNIHMKQRQLALEKKLLQQEIGALEKLKESYGNIGEQLITSYNNAISNGKDYFVSPVDGISGTINFEPNEVCYRQQEVVTVHNSKELMIRAYFSQKYNDYIQKGTIVHIEFSDGTTTKGKINNSYIATYALPSEFQKKYKPTERSILVDIIPINKDTEALWRKFYLMDVEIKMYKWSL